MSNLIRHRFCHGRMLLVLMFVFASIVPSSLNAAAMIKAQAVGGHHTMMGNMSGDQRMAAVHQSQDASAGFASESVPAGPDSILRRCCPATCFVALCANDVAAVDRLAPQSFENEAAPEFAVVLMALPERPPRA